MLAIMIAIIAVFLVSVIWIWHCLGNIEKNKRILFIIVGFILVFVLTSIFFQISKTGILYENMQIERDIKNTLVLTFTAVNSLILLPYVAKQFGKVKSREIDKEKFTKKIFLVIFIFVVCLVLEIGYMRDVQNGILQVYKIYQDVI